MQFLKIFTGVWTAIALTMAWHIKLFDMFIGPFPLGWIWNFFWGTIYASIIAAPAIYSYRWKKSLEKVAHNTDLSADKYAAVTSNIRIIIFIFLIFLAIIAYFLPILFSGF